MEWSAAEVMSGLGAERARRWNKPQVAAKSPCNQWFEVVGGTMARGETRVLSPFFPAARLAGGVTGSSRSGGEGS